MQAVLTSISPLEAGGEMFERVNTPSFFDRRTSTSRPYSEATDILETDFEEESDFEEYSPKGSFESEDGRRRSQTTLSSVDEAHTPRSSQYPMQEPLFEVYIKPVEGPRGPHLFRSSQASAEFTFDNALQMSPVLHKQKPALGGLRSQSAAAEDRFSMIDQQRELQDAIVAALDSSPIFDDDHESRIARWSTQDVVNWMLTAGLESSIIECFEVNDVDGMVLLDLEFDDLKELGILSFGKRHQLWSAISVLRGFEPIASPQPTPFQDISRPCTTIPKRSPSRSRSVRRHPEDDGSPTKATVGGKKRRGRKASKDIVTPAESVSIVAIEQLLPKPHVCSKGERCAKWRKQQRELQQLKDENAVGRFPVSPTKGGRIHVAGDPGNAATADNMIPNVRKQLDFDPEDLYRPTSEGFPSVIASSGLLSPNQLPGFALQEDRLSLIGTRDPQDNVRQFLNFQHMNSPLSHDEPSLSPTSTIRPDPITRSESVPPMFPSQHHQAYPSLHPPQCAQAPHDQLRSLPRLDIPQSYCPGGDPTAATSACTMTAIPLTACRSATASPTQAFRHGTPASEMDVPYLTGLAEVSRDNNSQSVPPNMQYRQTKVMDWRRPSLPAVKEGEEPSISVNLERSRSTARQSNTSSSADKVRDPAHHSPQTLHFGYGADCSHAGWMKKRKTKLLRHEWQDAHFRLKGTQLAMHSNARLKASTVDTINTEDYAVSCSSMASTRKLSAAMKAFNIMNDKAKQVDSTAFAFQLVPAGSESADKKKHANGKTHYFAVKNQDDRIDWMREIMLAKALQQKKDGYDVEINGVSK